MTAIEPSFRRMAEYAAQGCLVKPLLSRFFQDQELIFNFDLHLERSGQRAPDGWFHASTHPTATVHDLWLYLARPEDLPADPMGYVGWMSTMFGTVAHGVIEAALDHLGVMVPLPEGNCPACGRPYKPRRARQAKKWCMEHGAADPATRSRCHMDGILNLGGSHLWGFDFKTIRPMGLNGVPDMDPEFFREKWPKYWAQMQECMRLSGLRHYIVFFLTLGNPWEMREFHLDFDPAFAAETEFKYRRVIEAAEAGREIWL